MEKFLETMLLDYQREWIENPDFENRSRVHNWRNYIPEEFEQNWGSLPVETRQVIIIMAEQQASQEEWD